MGLRESGEEQSEMPQKGVEQKRVERKQIYKKGKSGSKGACLKKGRGLEPHTIFLGLLGRWYFCFLAKFNHKFSLKLIFLLVINFLS